MDSTLFSKYNIKTSGAVLCTVSNYSFYCKNLWVDYGTELRLRKWFLLGKYCYLTLTLKNERLSL
jgi:hypothetical protein